MSVNKFLNYL